MLKTIVFIIISFIFAIYFFRVLNGIEHKKLNINDILVFILAFLIILNANLVNKAETDRLNDAYNNGYNDAIHDAQLIGIGRNIYQLQFGDDIHEYTFSD